MSSFEISIRATWAMSWWDQCLFWQQPGTVFEDPVEGISAAHLLPDRTPLSDLASRSAERRRALVLYRMSSGEFVCLGTAWLDRMEPCSEPSSGRGVHCSRTFTLGVQTYSQTKTAKSFV